MKARNAIIGLESADDTESYKPSRGNNRQRGAGDKKQKSAGASQPTYVNEFIHTSSEVADPVVAYMNKEQLAKHIEQLRLKMLKAAKDMEFIEAARLRDEILKFENNLKDA